MPKKDTAQPSASAAAQSQPDPVLARKTARAVPPYRHAKTARTVAWHQPAGADAVHLFSVTGNHVATVPAAEAAAQEPKAAPAPAAPAPESSA